MINKKLYNTLMHEISKSIKQSLNEEYSKNIFTIGDEYDAYDIKDLTIYDENTLFDIIKDLDKMVTDNELDIELYEFEDPILVEYPQYHRSGRDYIEYKPIYIDAVYFDSEYLDLILYSENDEIGSYDKIEDEEIRKELLRKTIETISNIKL